LRELLARIRAILRRIGTEKPDSENLLVTIGDLAVNFGTYIATVDDLEVKLSHKEFDILHYLYAHKNEVVSRDDILNNIWGMDYQPTSRTIDNFILKLRQKIEVDHNDPRIILTVHGIGYKLIM
jgi:DNA-binding response OmpR family regulator